MKEEFGSLRRASKFYNVHWCTFNRLCQPPEIKKQTCQRCLVDIKTFYSRENISQPLPSIQCKGQCYLTKNVEESYALYHQDSMKCQRNVFLF